MAYYLPNDGAEDAGTHQRAELNDHSRGVRFEHARGQQPVTTDQLSVQNRPEMLDFMLNMEGFMLT